VVTKAEALRVLVADLDEQGMSSDEIAAALKVPVSRVDRILDEQDAAQGVPHPHRDRAPVLEPLGGPAVITSQAAVAGGSRDAVKEALAKQGPKRQARKEAPKAKPKPAAVAKPRPRVGRMGPALKPIVHGTANGALMHKRRGETVCEECRVAYNEERRLREQAKRVERGLPAVGTPGAKPQPINHGSETGYRNHKRRGETPCDVCHQAALAAWADRKLRAKEERHAASM
jgi:hypothetical protein